MTNVKPTNDKPWLKGFPPTDREIEILPSLYDGNTSAFYQDLNWWYVGVDSFGLERYSAGPTPEVWREMNEETKSKTQGS